MLHLKKLKDLACAHEDVMTVFNQSGVFDFKAPIRLWEASKGEIQKVSESGRDAQSTHHTARGRLWELKAFELGQR